MEIFLAEIYKEEINLILDYLKDNSNILINSTDAHIIDVVVDQIKVHFINKKWKCENVETKKEIKNNTLVIIKIDGSTALASNSLLYYYLELANSKNCKVIFITENSSAIDNMEKRVKSRFSNHVCVLRPLALDEYMALYKYLVYTETIIPKQFEQVIFNKLSDQEDEQKQKKNFLPDEAESGSEFENNEAESSSANSNGSSKLENEANSDTDSNELQTDKSKSTINESPKSTSNEKSSKMSESRSESEGVSDNANTSDEKENPTNPSASRLLNVFLCIGNQEKIKTASENEVSKTGGRRYERRRAAYQEPIVVPKKIKSLAIKKSSAAEKETEIKITKSEVEVQQENIAAKLIIEKNENFPETDYSKKMITEEIIAEVIHQYDLSQDSLRLANFYAQQKYDFKEYKLESLLEILDTPHLVILLMCSVEKITFYNVVLEFMKFVSNCKEMKKCTKDEIFGAFSEVSEYKLINEKGNLLINETYLRKFINSGNRPHFLKTLLNKIKL